MSADTGTPDPWPVDDELTWLAIESARDASLVVRRGDPLPPTGPAPGGVGIRVEVDAAARSSTCFLTREEVWAKGASFVRLTVKHMALHLSDGGHRANAKERDS